MKVVKEYIYDKRKIRIHDDYISQGNKETKEIIISIVIEYLKNRHI